MMELNKLSGFIKNKPFMILRKKAAVEWMTSPASRFTFDEDNYTTFDPVQNAKSCSLLEAVQPLTSMIPDIESYAKGSLLWAQILGVTSVDSSAALNLYTKEWPKGKTHLHALLNLQMSSPLPQRRSPFAQYLKLLFSALADIGPVGKRYVLIGGLVTERKYQHGSVEMHAGQTRFRQVRNWVQKSMEGI